MLVKIKVNGDTILTIDKEVYEKEYKPYGIEIFVEVDNALTIKTKTEPKSEKTKSINIMPTKPQTVARKANKGE